MKEKVNSLGTLQASAEQAARNLRTAKANLVRAKQMVDKAEAAHVTAQSVFQKGVEQVQSSTKVV